MIQQPFYCSLLSREDGEHVYGTASVGDVWLLVEYPTVWRTKALEASALPAEVKAHLDTLTRTIPRARLLFVKQGRACLDTFALFVVRARERGPSITRFDLTSYDELLDVDVPGLLAGRPVEGATETREPMFLVCTHGRRDKCCAKFGYPVYKSLSQHAGAALWQSSHVGGDRFAANVVCFPHGLFYARVNEASGRHILDEYRGGRVHLESYRGRACYTHPVQAAEYFVRRESGLVGIEDLCVVGASRAGETARLVRFEEASGGRRHEALVTWRESEFRNLITCRSHEQRSVPQYALAEYRTAEAGALAKA
jgi:hypothetical protein